MTTLPSAAAQSLAAAPDAFARACAADVAEARALAEQLATRAPADPLAVLALYDRASGLLGDAGARAGLARSVHPEAAFREAAERAEADVDAAATALSLDPRLAAALEAVDGARLDAASRHLLQKTVRDFRRAGVHRDAPTRARIRALREELVALGQAFGRNIKDDVRRLAVDPAMLAGLPDDFVRAHPPGPGGKVELTTDPTDYLPFVTYARDGKAREALWRLYRQRGHPANDPVLARMLAARAELAALVGYPSWAAYVAEDKMIGSAEAIDAFIARVASAAEGRLARDWGELVAFQRALLDRGEDSAVSGPAAGLGEIAPWDGAWLQERLRAERYGFDAREARPYFEYGRVKEGVLGLVGRLFGVRFAPAPDAPRWQEEVEVLDVHDAADGRTLGRVYLDMHPRDGKYKHYAQFTLASGKRGERLPEGVLVCNFPRPGAAPALLEHGEVRTFLHELGHLVHHVLGGGVRWASQSGVATEWDFVEVPSQLLEEWVWDADALGRFARHVESGAPIPAELVARMRRADGFGKGLWARQQAFYAALALELHRADPGSVDPGALAARLQERLTPWKPVPDTWFHLSFGHLDGYSALYYTYLWSLVIAKDFFGPFREHGLFDEATARRYRREVLERGGERPAAELVQAFLGRAFTFDAFAAWLEAA